MRLVIRPILDPDREIDLTHRLTAVIAEELWRQFGGNERLNWLEAELHLSAIVSAEGEGAARERRAESGMVASGVAPEGYGGGDRGPKRVCARPRRRTPGPARSARGGKATLQHGGKAVRGLG